MSESNAAATVALPGAHYVLEMWCGRQVVTIAHHVPTVGVTLAHTCGYADTNSPVCSVRAVKGAEFRPMPPQPSGSSAAPNEAT
jgi:hypothetical protein